jgi:hypothetical protein
MSLFPPWQPLRERYGDQLGAETLYEGVPPHLRGPLQEWIEQCLSDEPAKEIALRLRIDLVDTPNYYHGALEKLVLVVSSRFPDLMLDVVDAALQRENDRQAAEEMERILLLGGSAWRVARDGRSLERRVDETVREAVATAAPRETSAGRHLAAAWQAVYGRDPLPGRGYSEAIKAVEASAASIVSPANRRATLGTIIRDLEAAPQTWRLAIAVGSRASDIGALIAMMRLLWQGQSDRHGGSTPTVPISPEGASAAVHLAATLVHWFQAGLVGRVSS